MSFLMPKLDEYLEEFSSSESELLADLRRETFQKTVMPYMISGAYQGRLLSLISKMVNPNRILEIGTFTGYAALCLAEGLHENGKLITIDKNPELEFISKKYFQESEYKNQIEYINGNALALIPNIKESFDLVFLDADKKNYINYYDLVIEKLNTGGIILADNVLWYGKVLEQAEKDDEETKVLQTFNQKVKEDNRVEVVILPIRDGISIIRKK